MELNRRISGGYCYRQLLTHPRSQTVRQNRLLCKDKNESFNQLLLVHTPLRRSATQLVSRLQLARRQAVRTHSNKCSKQTEQTLKSPFDRLCNLLGYRSNRQIRDDIRKELNKTRDQLRDDLQNISIGLKKLPDSLPKEVKIKEVKVNKVDYLSARNANKGESFSSDGKNLECSGVQRVKRAKSFTAVSNPLFAVVGLLSGFYYIYQIKESVRVQREKEKLSRIKRNKIKTRAARIIEENSDNNVENLKEMLIKSPDLVIEKDKYGNQPIHIAARNGKEKALQCLIEYGSELNTPNKRDATPFYFACNAYANNFEIARKILTACLENGMLQDEVVNITTIDGSTPLIAAIWNYDIRVKADEVSDDKDNEYLKLIVSIQVCP